MRILGVRHTRSSNAPTTECSKVMTEYRKQLMGDILIEIWYTYVYHMNILIECTLS